jgi:hypothetical protein
MMSIDTSTRRLEGDITDTKKNCHEVLANARGGSSRRARPHVAGRGAEKALAELQTQLTKVEALTEHLKATGTGGRAEKPPKFDDTTSWALFRRQFDVVAEHNCWTHLEKSTYLITALQVRDAYVVHGVSNEALEDCFGDQYLACA